ncbi:MAG: hypothetical protein ACI4PJ_00540, partial [Acutalibacteraceae bacterium]
IKKSTATLLAALNVASPFASSAFATGTKEGSPEVDTVKTRTQTPTDINSKKHNNSSKERIAKMYENATKYVQEKFGLTREKAKSIVSSDYISQKYQSAIKYVQENFGLSRVQAESVVAAMGVTGSLATTLFIHQVYKALTPKKPQTNAISLSNGAVELTDITKLTISEDAKKILKDCQVKKIFENTPMFVFKINDDEHSNIMNHRDSMVDEGQSLYVIIYPMVSFNQDIKIVSEINGPSLYHFVLSTEKAKKLFSVDEIKVGDGIADSVAKSLSFFINGSMIAYTSNNDDALTEEKKKEKVKVEGMAAAGGEPQQVLPQPPAGGGAANSDTTNPDPAAAGGNAAYPFYDGNKLFDFNGLLEEEKEEEKPAEEKKGEGDGNGGNGGNNGGEGDGNDGNGGNNGGEGATEPEPPRQPEPQPEPQPAAESKALKSAKDMTDGELLDILKRSIKFSFTVGHNIDFNIGDSFHVTISGTNNESFVKNATFTMASFALNVEQAKSLFGLESIEEGKKIEEDTKIEIDTDIVEHIKKILKDHAEELNEFVRKNSFKVN